MSDQKRRDFVSVLNLLCAGFRVEPTEALLAFYWDALEDLTSESLRAAVKRAAREHTRLPSAADLRKLAKATDQRYVSGAIPGVEETARQLEAATSCGKHREDPDAPVTPAEFVPWCKRCQRFKRQALASARGERPAATIGEVVDGVLAKIGGRR